MSSELHDANQCAICYEEVKSQDSFTCSKCNQSCFHIYCILQSAEYRAQNQQNRNAQCALCKADITEDIKKICGDDIPERSFFQPVFRIIFDRSLLQQQQNTQNNMEPYQHLLLGLLSMSAANRMPVQVEAEPQIEQRRLSNVSQMLHNIRHRQNIQHIVQSTNCNVQQAIIALQQSNGNVMNAINYICQQMAHVSPNGPQTASTMEQAPNTG